MTTRDRPQISERDASIATISILAVLLSPLCASLLDAHSMRKEYENYMALQKKSDQPALDYEGYVDNYRREHPHVGRFYGIGRRN